jgi:hypothetical protein
VLVTMKEKHGAENVWNALFADGSNARLDRQEEAR